MQERLQPTYEDLKQDDRPDSLANIPRLQPTYEDLKLPHDVRAQVPAIGTFAAYLRGFETRRPGDALHNGSGKFAAYLRGFETHEACLIAVSRTGGLQPTYEDLKRS